MFRLILLLAMMLAATMTPAQGFDKNVQLELRTGWRDSDGNHMMALHFRLAPGWKTYWRHPGDVGIPPRFDFSGSRNLAAGTPIWPQPILFKENGMQSVGFEHELILPILLRPETQGRAIHLRGTVEIGICAEICVPVLLDLRGFLPSTGVKDPVIQRALRTRSTSARAAQVRSVTCEFRPIENGFSLRANIQLPQKYRGDVVLVENRRPGQWAAPAKVAQVDGGIAVTGRILSQTAGLVLERSAIGFSIITPNAVVVVPGCD